MRSEMTAPLSPREMSSLKRGSVSQCGSPIRLAQRLKSGWPITWARIQPSLVRKMSTGAAVWPRLPVGTRLGAITACSISSALPKVTAVASSAPSTHWPLPVILRAISAAMVPKAQCSAVPKSTQGTCAR